MELTGYNDFRIYLRDCLIEKSRKNPRYSQRAFAKQLGLSPTSLSEVLNGQKNISADRAAEISQALGLKEIDQQVFQLLVEASSSKNSLRREHLLERIASLQGTPVRNDLSIDCFRVLSDWYHFAIYELARLDNFTLTVESAAKKLDISRAEAKSALDRLTRLKLLIRQSNESYKIDSESNWLVQSSTANEALKNFHLQMLEKAAHALSHQPTKERITRTETLAFDPAELSKVDKALEEFISKLNHISRQSKKKSEVYHFNFQSFRLTAKGRSS